MVDVVNVILFSKFSWKNVGIIGSIIRCKSERVYKQAYENSHGRNRFPKIPWTRNKENGETAMVFARNKLADLVRYTFDKSWLYRWFKEPFCWVRQSQPASLSADSISFLVSPFRLSSFFRVASSLSLSRVHGVTHRRCPLLLAYLLLGA